MCISYELLKYKTVVNPTRYTDILENIIQVCLRDGMSFLITVLDSKISVHFRLPINLVHLVLCLPIDVRTTLEAAEGFCCCL